MILFCHVAEWTECSTKLTFKFWIFFRPTRGNPSRDRPGRRLAPSAVLERIRKLEARASSAATARRRSQSHRPRTPRLRRRPQRGGPASRTLAHALADARGPRSASRRRRRLLPVKVRARDAEHLGQLLRTRFGRIPGVRSTRTTIVLETVKETPRLPVRSGAEELRMTPSRTRAPPRLLRLGRGLPDLGDDVPRHPHQPRDDAAGADGRPAVDDRRRAARALLSTRGEKLPPPSSGGGIVAARLPDARPRQRRRRLCRAVRPERPRGRRRRHVAVLDGGRRGVSAQMASG